MRITDDKLLAAIRNEGRCCWTGEAGPVDAAHIFSRGAGRVDIPGNVVPLGRLSHQMQHTGEIADFDLLAIAAARESRRLRTNVGQDAILETVWLFRRLPKGTTDLGPHLEELTGTTREYARRCWEEWRSR